MLKALIRRIAQVLAILALLASSASAGTTIKILQAVDLPANLPFWIAVEQGLFAKRGIDAELVSDDAPGVASRITGEVQFGILGVPAIMNAVSQGRNLKMLFPIYAPRSTQVLMARRGIHSIADLKGKRLGVFTVGTGFWIQAMLALEHLGVDIANHGLQFVPVGNLARLFDAMRSGAIDASTFDPGRARQLELEGYSVLLDMYPANIMGSQSGFAVIGTLIRDRHQLVANAVEASIEGAAYSLAAANREVVLATLARRLRLDSPGAVQAAFTAFRRYVERKPYPSIEAMNNMRRIMALHDPRVLQLKLEDAVDDRFVRQLDQSGRIDEIYEIAGR